MWNLSVHYRYKKPTLNFYCDCIGETTNAASLKGANKMGVLYFGGVGGALRDALFCDLLRSEAVGIEDEQRVN